MFPSPAASVLSDTIAVWFRGEKQAVPIERMLTALPSLPNDVSYALFEFNDRRIAAQAAANPVIKAASAAP